jgi:hypothetical protein
MIEVWGLGVGTSALASSQPVDRVQSRRGDTKCAHHADDSRRPY